MKITKIIGNFNMILSLQKKTDFSPDDPEFLRKKRFRNRLVFLLYIDVLIIFLLANNLASHILEMIVN